LQDWKRFNGHTCVPISNEDLGSWVSKQRQSHKKGKLSPHKQVLLDSIGFTWSTSDADWDAKFADLCKWRAEHGHTMVPFNEGGLGWWSNTQRQSRRKGKMSQSRVSRLDSVDFVWNPSHRRVRSKSISSQITEQKPRDELQSAFSANSTQTALETQNPCVDADSSYCTSFSGVANAGDVDPDACYASISRFVQPGLALNQESYVPSYDSFQRPEDVVYVLPPIRYSATGDHKVEDPISFSLDGSQYGNLVFQNQVQPLGTGPLGYPTCSMEVLPLHLSQQCHQQQNQRQFDSQVYRPLPVSSLDILNLMAYTTE
jgi:Helicase associated domain